MAKAAPDTPGTALSLRAHRHAGWGAALALMGALAQGGCSTGPGANDGEPLPRPLARDTLKLAEPATWYARPAAASVSSSEFDALWQACIKASRGRGFTPDQHNFRGGVLTTLPLISKQAAELWKSDVITTDDLANSSLSTLRRTIRFQIRHLENGSYGCEPKVLVERFSMVEHRITSATQYRDIFTLSPQDIRREKDRERDPTMALSTPPLYWYPIGRDTALERAVADDVARLLHTTAGGPLPPEARPTSARPPTRWSARSRLTCSRRRRLNRPTPRSLRPRRHRPSRRARPPRRRRRRPRRYEPGRNGIPFHLAIDPQGPGGASMAP